MVGTAQCAFAYPAIKAPNPKISTLRREPLG
jgi:hypothetical protein